MFLSFVRTIYAVRYKLCSHTCKDLKSPSIYMYEFHILIAVRHLSADVGSGYLSDGAPRFTHLNISNINIQYSVRSKGNK